VAARPSLDLSLPHAASTRRGYTWCRRQFNLSPARLRGTRRCGDFHGGISRAVGHGAACPRPDGLPQETPARRVREDQGGRRRL